MSVLDEVEEITFFANTIFAGGNFLRYSSGSLQNAPHRSAHLSICRLYLSYTGQIAVVHNTFPLYWNIVFTIVFFFRGMQISDCGAPLTGAPCKNLKILFTDGRAVVS
jgi:hypothetical protein